MYDVLEDKLKAWNDRFPKCIEARFHTQAAFREAMNDKFETEFSQQTVNRWVHIGSSPNGRKRGFPTLEHMLMIAETLGVDLGYLLGETEYESFSVEKACEFLGLSSNAIRVLTLATGLTSAFHTTGMMSTESRALLNKLLTAKRFPALLRSLGELEHAYDSGFQSENDIMDKLKAQLGSKMYAEAAKWDRLLDESYDGPEPSEEIFAAVKAYQEAVGNAFGAHENARYATKCLKYELFGIYTSLIEELYCSNES